MTQNPGFKERLLAAAQVDPGLREQYESELNAIIHKQLRPGQKRLYGSLAAFRVLLGAAFGLVSVSGDSLDAVIRIILAVAAVYSVSDGVRIGMVAYRGRLDRRQSLKWRMGAVYIAIVFGLWIAYVMRAGTTGVSGDALILMFLGVLVGILVFCTGWIGHVIAQADLRNREDALEMKLHLAAISRELKNPTQ